MNKIRSFITIILLVLSIFSVQLLFARQERYFPPSDTAVKNRLAWWGNVKFGLLMHWGTYSQWGIVESRSLCPEDESWCNRTGPYAMEYFEYKKAYENLKTTFNPKANITLEIFNAFRKSGFGIGAYFSKPDWHCPDYWDPYFPPFDRNPSYDYEPASELIRLLCLVVSRGGNFLLNVAPGPQGDFDSVAYSRLKEIGKWMKINSEAIYGTRTQPPYASGKFVFTAKGINTVYTIYLPDKDEIKTPANYALVLRFKIFFQ